MTLDSVSHTDRLQTVNPSIQDDGAGQSRLKEMTRLFESMLHGEHSSGTSPLHSGSTAPHQPAPVDAAPVQQAPVVAKAAPDPGTAEPAKPESGQVVKVGTGTDATYNVTNNTAREQSFTYSVGDTKATVTLKPGETGTFLAGSGDVGERISPSDAQGNTHPDEKIFENGAGGMVAGAQNADISAVDGQVDFTGQPINMKVALSDGRTAGDGEAIRAYQNPTDDSAAMGLAGDTSKTFNIVVS